MRPFRPALLLTAATLAAALSGCGHSATPAGSPDQAGAAAGASTTTGPAGPAVSRSGLPPAAAPTTSSPPPSTTHPATTTTPPSTTAPTTVPPPVPDANVLALQQQLSALGYWLGAADGVKGDTTTQAVVALQKASGLPRTGVFGPETAAALAAGTRPAPQSTSGHVIEVDLAHQLVLIVTNGHLDGILNTSTGGGYRYYDHGSTQVAITPVGHFATNWEVNGTRVSSLGVLWRPKFFVGGIAIHGDGSVPSHPASHGCVRVSNPAINWIWSAGLDPIGTPVWVY